MNRSCVVLFWFAILPVAARAQSTTRVSLTSAAAEANSFSERPSISANGRYVAFMSLADNLAPGDLNGAFDIFVRDRNTGQTILASCDSAGTIGDGSSAYPAISANGQFVAFESFATNLVAGDLNGTRDIFVRDLVGMTTTRVSVASSGDESHDAGFFQNPPAISSDGRFVAFESLAPDLVMSDLNGLADVFLRDRQNNTTVRVSVDPGGLDGNSSSGHPAISGDGRFVVFDSAANNLVAGDLNTYKDVFLRDMQTSTTFRMSVSTAGVGGDNRSSSPCISATGQFVAFDSLSTNLVTGDSNGWGDVFVRDRLSMTTTRVSLGFGGAQGNRESNDPAISGDGSIVAFRSLATNLVIQDTNEAPDVFAFNRATSTLTRVDVDSANLQANDYAVHPSLNSTGQFIAYYSLANNLVPTDLNQSSDVFLQDRALLSPFTPFCFGDGTGTPCPCGNNGGPRRGCANSTPANQGAQLSGAGVASIAADTVVLTASGVTGPGLFFQGNGQFNGGPGMAFGDGLQCAGGTIVRIAVVFPVGNVATYPNVTTPTPVHTAGLIAAPGVFTYQCWYRDAQPFCSASNFNLTQGLSILWAP